MKKSLSLLALLLLLIFSSNSLTTNGTAKSSKQRGVANFDQPVKLLGVELKGEYLFIHDDEAMLRGDACTYVYKGTAERPEKLVLSFHCIPQLRKKASHFAVRSNRGTGVDVIEEIQFAGSSESHLVPTMPHHYVGVVGF